MIKFLILMKTNWKKNFLNIFNLTLFIKTVTIFFKKRGIINE